MKEIQLQTPSGRNMEFTDETGGHEEKLIVLVWGEEHVGKSRLGVTGPDVVGFIPTDRKSRYTAEKTAKEFGKKMLMPKNDFVREALKGVRAAKLTEEKNDAEIAKMTEDSKKEYRSLVNQVKECAWTLYDRSDVELIEIDLFSQFYEDMKYAHYGRTGHVVKRLSGTKMFKSTEQADQEIIDFVNSLTGKHLVLTHKSKEEYVNDKNTGNRVWQGFKGMGHLCNLQVEMVVNKRFDPTSDKPEHQWHYGLNVVKSLHNPMLEGAAGQLLLTDDMISFENLMTAVFEAS
jgi:hypothetical protein